jgi:hypothetical protein
LSIKHIYGGDSGSETRMRKPTERRRKAEHARTKTQAIENDKLIKGEHPGYSTTAIHATTRTLEAHTCQDLFQHPTQTPTTWTFSKISTRLVKKKKNKLS